MKEKLTRAGYGQLLVQLKERIRKAQYQALQTVNRELIKLYWNIGRMIVEFQRREEWGSGVVEKISRDLRREFPESRGFSSQNLWRMRQFYEVYRRKPILSTLSRELPWFHNVLLMKRTRTEGEKAYYLRACAENRWSFRELERQVKALAYERSEETPCETPPKPQNRKDAVLAHFKNEYILDLLELKDRHNEKELRKAILNNLKDFFLEFGRHFTFAGEEYRLNVGGDDFYVDLLFYHRLLRCFVAVELKTGKFKPEYAGKMQFYLAALDEKIKTRHENPSVGIILCKSKNEEVVRIAVSRTAAHLRVATYKTRLIDTELLKRRLHSLPTPTA
ncbi:MAG: PDDEXK nuclease domain-containing protein [Candidatus Omnitrophota bacterium]